MKACLPDCEEERLRALRLTGLMDSAPEDEFDSLVRLASAICDTPIALVTLVDGRRQWFKANLGLEASETDRDIAFCSHAILQSDLFIVTDALKDVRFAENPLVIGDPWIRFYAGMPLENADGFRLGTLCVIDRAPRTLTEGQRRSLQLLAEQANKQINLRQQRNVLQEAIAEGSLIERELRANQALFHSFMDHSPFLALMKAADGRMVYYNQRFADRFGVSREAWLGKTDRELWPKETAEKHRAQDLSVLREAKLLVVEEQADPIAEEDPTFWRSYKFPFQDSEGGEYVAGFAVDITADRRATLQIQAYQQALEEANQKLHALATTDGLTQLMNRRAFETVLENQLTSASRYSQPLSLLILDIDNFKFFNDTFGHEEGDRVLKCVAGVIARCFRNTDVVARYGGEEFAVLLPNTAKHAAADSAERLRQAVAECEIEPHAISVSVGLCTLEAVASSKKEFVRRADEALYRAKREGKNRVCAA